MPTKREYPPFNEWLRRKKAEHRYTNKTLAAALGVDPSAVARWLRGERLPERTQVVELALLFKVSPLEILWITDRKALQEEAEATEQQQSAAELVAHVPELAEFVDLLWKLPPKRRAALILLARESASDADTPE